MKHAQEIADGARVAALKTAEDRVGASEKQRLAWFLKFLSANAEDFTAGDIYNKRLEVAALRFRPRKLFPSESDNERWISEKAGILPSEQQIWRIHDRLRALARSFQVDGEIGFDYPKRPLPSDPPLKHEYVVVTSVALSKREAPGGGKPRWHFSQSVSDPVTDCMIRFTKLLESFGANVKICDPQQFGCGRWFLAKRTDAVWCGDACQDRFFNDKKKTTAPNQKTNPKKRDKGKG